MLYAQTQGDLREGREGDWRRAWRELGAGVCVCRRAVLCLSFSTGKVLSGWGYPR